MSNRVVLMTLRGSEAAPRLFLEWPYAVPLLHYLLIGHATKVVPSALYDGETALRGDAEPGRALTLSFLDWLASRAPASAARCETTRAVLTHPMHLAATAYLLEPSDAYAMNEDTAEGRTKMTEDDAAASGRLVQLVTSLVADPGSSLKQAQSLPEWRLTDALADLDTSMGLCTSLERVVATWTS